LGARQSQCNNARLLHFVRNDNFLSLLWGVWTLRQTMPLSMRFMLVRLIIVGMLVASQLYLFVRGYRVVLLSRWSPQRKKLLRRGLGTTVTPVRVNAPPEITLFHLT